VIKREDVALGTERVISGSNRSRKMDSGRWTRNSGLNRRRAKSPHIEIVFVFLEWRSREKHIQQAARIAFEFAAFGSGIAIAEHQEIYLLRGIAVLHEFDQCARRGWTRRVDEHVLGIDIHRPHSRNALRLSRFFKIT